VAPPNVRWQRGVPQALAALDTLVYPDYTDVVTGPVSSTSDMTPEQAARAVLGNLPRSLVLFVPFAQRAVLGLRLRLRPSPDHLLGWKIAARGEDWIRIEAASWFLTGHVVMQATDGVLSFATFVRYDRWLAALVWPPVSLIHRQVAIALVRSAARVG
jgi:hypothetical protein